MNATRVFVIVLIAIAVLVLLGALFGLDVGGGGGVVDEPGTGTGGY